MKDPDWTNLKGSMKVFSYKTLGWIAMQKKENEKAEAAFAKTLELDPSAGQVSFWMGNVILAQRKPDKQVYALYHYARAASYDGTGALTAADRAQVKSYVAKIYNQYHGSAEGFEEFLGKAKDAALPVGEVKIKSARQIAEEDAAKDADFAKNNPEMALWMSIKKELTGPDAEKYFGEHLKETLLPKLKGKLVSATPEAKPKELVLSILESTGDVTIRLDAALAGKMDPGSELSFEGVPGSYTKEPFMVVFEVEKAKLVGWKGAAVPAPKKTGGATAPKKAAPAAKKK
jgi:tetratricopeptide (TPR) repeat protein